MGLFGGSSKSTSTSSTTNQDNRSVADAQAQSATAGGQNVKDQAVNQPITIGASGKSHVNANVQITNTDFGAVKAAFDFADATEKNAALSIKSALGVAEGVFNQSTEAVDKAYQEAKGGATVVQNLAVGALVAAVAVVYFITNKGKHA